MRAVVVGDGVGDVVAKVFGFGEIATNDALHFREFADRSGDEVGLGKPRGQFGVFDVRADLFGDFAGEAFDALHAVSLGAEFGVEDDVVELGQARFERDRLVVVPEEFGVRQARAQHALVAGDDGLAAVARFEVGDDQELLGQLSVRIGEREVFLVFPHRADEDFLRHFEERRIEAAGEDDGVFHEAGDLFQQFVVVVEGEAGVGGGAFGLLVDDLHPLGAVEDHAALAQLHLIIGEVRHLERLVRHLAVAARDVRRGEPGDFDRHHDAVEKAQDRAQRAHPLQTRRLPLHGFRPGEGADRFNDRFGDEGGRGASILFDFRDVEIAFGIGLDLKLVSGEAGLFQKAVERGGGRRGARAFEFLRHGGGRGGQVFDHQRQAARGDMRDGVCGCEAALREGLHHQAFEVIGGLALHPGGDFFLEEFEEELGHQPCSPSVRPWGE